MLFSALFTSLADSPGVPEPPAHHRPHPRCTKLIRQITARKEKSERSAQTLDLKLHIRPVKHLNEAAALHCGVPLMHVVRQAPPRHKAQQVYEKIKLSFAQQTEMMMYLCVTNAYVMRFE